MNKLRSSIEKQEERLKQRWERLPLRRQRQLIVGAFILHSLLTVGVVGQAWKEATTQAATTFIMLVEPYPNGV
jgi:hypothetical protein